MCPSIATSRSLKAKGSYEEDRRSGRRHIDRMFDAEAGRAVVAGGGAAGHFRRRARGAETDPRSVRPPSAECGIGRRGGPAVFRGGGRRRPGGVVFERG